MILISWSLSSQKTSRTTSLPPQNWLIFTGQMVKGHQSSRSRFPGAGEMQMFKCSSGLWLKQEDFLGEVILEPELRAVIADRRPQYPSQRTARDSGRWGPPGLDKGCWRLGRSGTQTHVMMASTRKNASRFPKSNLNRYWREAKWEEQSRSKTRTYPATRPP